MLFNGILCNAIVFVILFWGMTLIISGPFFTFCCCVGCWFWFSSFFSLSFSFSFSLSFSLSSSSFFSSCFWLLGSIGVLFSGASPPTTPVPPSFPGCCAWFFSSFSFSFGSTFPSAPSFFFFLSFLDSSTSIIIGFLFPPLESIPFRSIFVHLVL